MAADLAKLRKKASELEAKKDISGAVAAYRQIIDLFEAGGAEPIDIPLYNRLGDLLMKDGRSTDAIQIWERAVEQYVDGGFLNPAIALANKILRASPGRTAAYYTLGRCLGQKGLRAEARQNFLEYATRMQRAGNLDEALRALQELADLVPDQHDVRVMLAEELAKADRVPEAVEQLQLAHARLSDAGRTDEAAVVATRARELDSTVAFPGTVRGSGAAPGGLVFLDLDGRPASDAVESASTRRPERLDGLEPTAVVEPVDIDLVVEIPVDVGPLAADAPAAAAPPRVSLLDLPLLDVAGLDLPRAGGGEGSGAPRGRPTSSVLLRPIDLLRADLEGAPDDARLRRAYGEALIDEGEREAGIVELDAALAGLEASGDLDAARQVAEDLVRMVPSSLAYHRRRVELCLAVGAADGAVDAALALGERLVAQGAGREARLLYARVLALAPDDVRAQAALGALEAAVAVSAGETAADATALASDPGTGMDDVVLAAEWFPPRTRPTTARAVLPGEGVEDGVAIEEILNRFKTGIASGVEASDHTAHYDLGVAYREMGLLDEAVAQFQKAIRSAPDRCRVIEALGGCFLEKGQAAIAATVLRRALSEPGVTDDALLGVLYLLAESALAIGDQAEAVACLERIVGIDIGFRDAASRLERLQAGGAESPPAPKQQS
ncbi:MAG: tetratricopeptide repeat protein [Gemmatimonadetes bacterium]|nr:tetratricopeptide repeat protein [Gemmatimonadota bacterium]